MKAVSIDYDKCNVCSVCIQTSRTCFSKKGGRIEIEADDKTCMLCGHCVAACPSAAITHNIMGMSNFPAIEKGKLIRTDDLVRLIRERRSHRSFTKKKLRKQDIEKLVDTVRYAPTGHNDQTVELIIIQNPERRKSLSDLAVDFCAVIAKQNAEKLASLRANGKGSPEEIAQLEEVVEFRRMLVQARDAGFDPLLYEAPAVAIFHSTTQTATPKDNCVIAATTMGLLARTMGLATTYIALFEHAGNYYAPLRDELGLPQGHKVFSVLVIGYPKIKYLRAVDRKPTRTRWE
jgi:nitroreductase/NAD-dependent dihydropyrimidine dehydrogenase PreA subunit